MNLYQEAVRETRLDLPRLSGITLLLLRSVGIADPDHFQISHPARFHLNYLASRGVGPLFCDRKSHVLSDIRTGHIVLDTAGWSGSFLRLSGNHPQHPDIYIILSKTPLQENQGQVLDIIHTYLIVQKHVSCCFPSLFHQGRISSCFPSHFWYV